MKTKTKLTIGVSVVLSVLGVLIFVGIGNAQTFYMTVDEVVEKKSEAVGKRLKVSGKIVGESIHWDPENILLTFEIEGENGSRIPIQYDGVKPDTLNDSWEAIVGGRLTEEGTFVASELLVKCPSKYEAMEKSDAKPPKDYQDKMREYNK